MVDVCVLGGWDGLWWLVLEVVWGCGHGVLYGRPSVRAKKGIQKPVQNWLFSALPKSEGWFERGWCNIWWVLVGSSVFLTLSAVCRGMGKRRQTELLNSYNAHICLSDSIPRNFLLHELCT